MFITKFGASFDDPVSHVSLGDSSFSSTMTWCVRFLTSSAYWIVQTNLLEELLTFANKSVFVFFRILYIEACQKRVTTNYLLVLVYVTLRLRYCNENEVHRQKYRYTQLLFLHNEDIGFELRPVCVSVTYLVFQGCAGIFHVQSHKKNMLTD